LVIVANHTFEKYIEIAPFMASMLQHAQQTQQKEKNPIVIIGKQFSVPFVQSVSDVVKGAKFPIILLSANYHNDTFEDIASFVDAKLIDTHPKKGTKITDLKLSDAGFIKSIVARQTQTQFIGGRGLELADIKDSEVVTRVSKRVAEIKEMQKSVSKMEEREQMDRRVGALLGGITTVYVDAKTTTERFYLKKKAEDAINSCVSALNDGMVQGGGLAYKEVAEELGESSVLYASLNAPFERIVQNNSGKEFDLTNVYDSYTGMKSAIENAVSTVKVVLTLEGIIADFIPSVVEGLKEVNE
jgi:chaperonin GroEL (HSP60 family)